VSVRCPTDLADPGVALAIGRHVEGRRESAGQVLLGLDAVGVDSDGHVGFALVQVREAVGAVHEQLDLGPAPAERHQVRHQQL
jgi:hypothetical protein